MRSSLILAPLILAAVIGVGLRPAYLTTDTHPAPPSPPTLPAALYVPGEPTGHALVPSGLHTISELTHHLALYPGLDVTQARFLLNPYGFFAYVSYRDDHGNVRWTRKMRWIKAGEPLIISGDWMILERCGNQVQLERPPLDTTSSIVPADVYPPDIASPTPPLDLTAYNPPPASLVPITAPPANYPTYSLIPPPTSLLVPLGGPLTSVPEPPSGWLLVIGLMLVLSPMVLRPWL